MEKHYRYHLLDYAGPASRLRCPSCGRHRCFTPYVDNEGVPADAERYGRCDHESSCGYCEYPPSEQFRQGGYVSAMRNFEKRPFKTKAEPKPSPCTIPEDIVRESVVFSPKNAFIAFLLRLFTEERVKELVELYQIGTTKEGYTVFYQIDTQARVRTGKIIPYNPVTGHRIKDGSVPEAMWVHSRLKSLHQLPDDWTLTQCLFGEHLLTLFPDKTVGLVESEKTAVICAAAMPEYVWMATGGKSQFNDRLRVLQGRRIVAFPDIDAYDLWLRKIKDYTRLDITVSDWLNANATEKMMEEKWDIGDVVVK